MPRRDTNYMCLLILKIESGYLKLEEHRYYPQVFLEVCRYGADNRALQLLDESDESDNMPEKSGEEFNSDYKSDDADNES